MKRAILVVVLLAVAYFGDQQRRNSEAGNSTSVAAGSSESNYSEWRAGDQVRGFGTVARVLSDDNDGSRHQRLIVQLPSGQTILIAHNIDVAPRVSSVSKGDSIEFYGEFESNPQGGVVHWTHKDHRGDHIDGWLEHNGQRYW